MSNIRVLDNPRDASPCRHCGTPGTGGVRPDWRCSACGARGGRPVSARAVNPGDILATAADYWRDLSWRGVSWVEVYPVSPAAGGVLIAALLPVGDRFLGLARDGGVCGYVRAMCDGAWIELDPGSLEVIPPEQAPALCPTCGQHVDERYPLRIACPEDAR